MKSHRQLPAQFVRRALFLVFTISGFAGLIYESIWSHYLKLMLGHAAYAQTLVLVLFMGGMAIGSWLCGRVSARIARPLLAYALVEAILGIFAWCFDPIFRTAIGFVLQTAAPALAEPFPLEVLKWTIAGVLILPACVLLGATFPLISVAVVRMRPDEAGNSLGWLYFTNSLGAVVGVLTSGFVLIGKVGLPGTLITAGLCNLGLALVVYAIGRRSSTPPIPLATSSSAAGTPFAAPRLLLAIAFLTGAASFFYEIGWIRMLSLVLGSATHSFELMLAAFILGLALGALWIRNRIDGITDPMRLLAWVQIIMGFVALCTLVVYGWSFDWMAAIVGTLQKSSMGYVWFTVLSQGICMVLMVPVTFFAGMTLPLITSVVLRTGGGESAIGRVYAANTWGSILGVILAVHLVMPTFGLRNVVVTGALIDLSLGLWLFGAAGSKASITGRVTLASLLIAAIVIVAFVKFDLAQLSSGVYRYATATRPGEVVFHKDGRTASIDVSRSKDGTLTLLTNGKPDAGLSPSKVTGDDYTMVLLGVMPLALRPDAQEAAVIGLGSGRTTHVLLGSPAIKSVDTIEIEPAIAEGARLLGKQVDRTFNDRRSHIHFEDAKTFFARHQKKYDIIASEPSNPWVSGVASLYTEEFYQQVKGHLAPGGVFVQWLQLYEFDDLLVASIGRAMESAFEDYAIYETNDGDTVIVAVPFGALADPDASVLEWPNIKPLTDGINVRTLADLQVRWVADRALAAPYFAAQGAPPNSDYFPFLDQRAGKYRFMKTTAGGLAAAQPVTARIAGRSVRYEDVFSGLADTTKLAAGASQLIDYFAWKYGPKDHPPPNVGTEVLTAGVVLGRILDHCNLLEVRAVWRPALEGLAMVYWPYLDTTRAQRLTAPLRQHACTGDAKRTVDGWLNFLDTIASKNWEEVSKQGSALIAVDQGLNARPSAFLAREVMLADYQRMGMAGALLRGSVLAPTLPPDPSIRYLRLVSGGG